MFLIGKSWWMPQPENMAASALKDKGPSTYSTWGYQMLIGSFVGTKTNGLTDRKGHVWWVIRNSFLIDADVLLVREKIMFPFIPIASTCMVVQICMDDWIRGTISENTGCAGILTKHFHSEGLDEAGCPAFGTMALSHVSSLEGCIDSCSCMIVGHHVIAPKFG